MKKLSKKLILAAGSLTLGALVAVGVLSQTASAADPTTPATYVGQATCAKCHADKVKDYSMTGHSTALRPISDYNLTNPGISVTIYGSDIKQSATIKLDASNTAGVMMGEYVVAKPPAGSTLPDGYYRVAMLTDNKNGTYTLAPAGTKDFGDGKASWTGSSMASCQNCHAPGVASAAANAGGDSGITCESCHGPGSNHVQAADKKGSYAIPGPETCYKCHPVDNSANANGSNGLPSKDAATGTWSATNHYGVRGFYATKHYTSAKLNSCLTCHDVHEEPKAGYLLAVSDKHNDTAANLCNQCHAGHITDASITSAFWVNPTDAHGHTTVDHSMFQIPLSNYVADTNARTFKLGPKAVNQLRTLYPSYFNK